MTTLQLGLVFVVSFVAGGVNSVAGGGTLLTFPVLLAGGLNSIVANATNSAGLAPGALASFLGYRKELAGLKHLMLPLAVIALIGATIGALLLLATPTKIFDRLIPFLILAATLLFAFQDRLKKLGRPSPRPRSSDTPLPTSLVPRASLGEGEGGVGSPPSPKEAVRNELTLGEGGRGDEGHQDEGTPLDTGKLTPSIAFFLLGVAIYGGYFGAGIGILTLAALGMLGMTEIHRMNGLKTIFTGGLNVVASVVLMLKGKVDFPVMGVMIVGAMLGGWLAVGVARKLGAGNVRKLVIAIGVVLSVQTLLRYWMPPLPSPSPNVLVPRPEWERGGEPQRAGVRATRNSNP